MDFVKIVKLLAKAVRKSKINAWNVKQSPKKTTTLILVTPFVLEKTSIATLVTIEPEDACLATLGSLYLKISVSSVNVRYQTAKLV